MVQIEKVVTELRGRVEDPFEKDIASMFIKRLRDVEAGKTATLGRLFYDLLVKAEKGDFK